MAFRQDMLNPQRMYTQRLVSLVYFDRNGWYSPNKSALILVPIPAFKRVFTVYRNHFFSNVWRRNYSILNFAYCYGLNFLRQ